MSLDAFRAALDAAPGLDTPTFARRARNAIAQAIVSSALTRPEEATRAGGAAAPALLEPAAGPAALLAHVGAELAEDLVAVYRGDPDWTSHAIAALAPLHALAR